MFNKNRANEKVMESLINNFDLDYDSYESEDSPQLISLMYENMPHNVDKVTDEKNEQINQISRDVSDIKEITLSIHKMLETQGEQLNTIESQVDNANDNLKKADQHLTEAIGYNSGPNIKKRTTGGSIGGLGIGFILGGPVGAAIGAVVGAGCGGLSAIIQNQLT
jgi:methyl-accepting chemotaxis protein